MALWKTSTAGSARSTSTSSNRRQACLKAALRGGFLISPPLPPRRAISFGTARYRSPYGLRYALAWRCSVQNRKKNEHRRHTISHGLGRKMPHSKPVSAFELPQMNASIFSFPKRRIAKLTQALNRQTKSRHHSWSRSFMYSSNASKSMRQSEDRATRKEPPHRVAL